MTSNLKLYSCEQKKVKHLNPVIAIGTVYFCTEFSISCIYITGGFFSRCSSCLSTRVPSGSKALP